MLCKGDIVRHLAPGAGVLGLGLVVEVLPESATVLWLKAGYQSRHENHWLAKVEVGGE